MGQASELCDVVHGGDITPSEGEAVDIQCSIDPSKISKLLIWFRIVNHRVEFIGSFTKNFSSEQKDLFNATKTANRHTLHVRSFQATRDIGVYACTMFAGGTLTLGEATRLIGRVQTKAPITQPPVVRPAPTKCPCEATRDIGVYVCATFAGGMLTFGESTRLIGRVQTKAPITQQPVVRPAPTKCPCEKTEAS
ncbi:hypothetical protein CRUP_015033 [Coryphaenoides rupestris]|nr:hypothetical protein CRUP_015033 [Coryphaenoides rupestris]